MIATAKNRTEARYHLHNPTRNGNAWDSDFTYLPNNEFFLHGRFYDYDYDFQPEFKVGDRVKIVRDVFDECPEVVGQTVTVLDPESEGLIKVETSRRQLWCKPEELEPEPQVRYPVYNVMVPR